MSSMYGSQGMQAATGRNSGNKVPSGYQKGQLQQFTPEQMQLFQSLFSHLLPGSNLAGLAGGDESAFAEMEAPALKQFNALQGNLASRFSGGGGGRGAMSSRLSSGFQNASSQAASDFASQLQSQRQGLKRQALQDLMGLSEGLLGQRPYEQFLSQKKKSPWQDFLSSLGGGLGKGIGSLPGLFF